MNLRTFLLLASASFIVGCGRNDHPTVRHYTVAAISEELAGTAIEPTNPIDLPRPGTKLAPEPKPGTAVRSEPSDATPSDSPDDSSANHTQLADSDWGDRLLG